MEEAQGPCETCRTEIPSWPDGLTSILQRSPIPQRRAHHHCSSVLTSDRGEKEACTFPQAAWGAETGGFSYLGSRVVRVSLLMPKFWHNSNMPILIILANP